MTRAAGGFLPGVAVDRGLAVPLHEQIVAYVERAIRLGTVTPGERIPSPRLLASRLRVSRNTVLAAYDELVARGGIEGRCGGGMHVTGLDATARNCSATRTASP